MVVLGCLPTYQYLREFIYWFQCMSTKFEDSLKISSHFFQAVLRSLWFFPLFSWIHLVTRPRKYSWTKVNMKRLIRKQEVSSRSGLFMIINSIGMTLSKIWLPSQWQWLLVKYLRDRKSHHELAWSVSGRTSEQGYNFLSPS